MNSPMDVPPNKSTGTPSSSSAIKTPTCANPRAPPPASTKPHALPSQRTRQPRGVRGGEAVRGRPRGVVMSVDAEKKTPLF